MFVNLYGPTEITCNCTYHVVDRMYENGEVIPIGKAFPNEKVFLLDEMNQLIDESDVDHVGELCISGTALALGYFNNVVYLMRRKGELQHFMLVILRNVQFERN